MGGGCQKASMGAAGPCLDGGPTRMYKHTYMHSFMLISCMCHMFVFTVFVCMLRYVCFSQMGEKATVIAITILL